MQDLNAARQDAMLAQREATVGEPQRRFAYVSMGGDDRLGLVLSSW